jgi:hypothetical protein
METDTLSFLLISMLTCFASLPGARVVVSPPDEGYANLTMAEESQRSQSQVLTLIGPIVGEESDKCGIITQSGEDVAWDEASESRWTWE